VYYDRVKAKKGSGKAIIAMVKKISGIIYHTLKYDWVFKDFTQFELQTNGPGFGEEIVYF
jgi:transposase